MAKKPAKRTAGRGKAVVITGIKEIDRKLKRLEPVVQKRALRTGMRNGMKIIAAAVRAVAPKKTGALIAAVKTRAIKSKKRGNIGIEVRIGNGDFKGDQYYAAFVEFGTKLKKTAIGKGLSRLRKKFGFGSGGQWRIKPRHYMENAFKQKAEQARQVAMTGILAAIEKYIKAGK